MVIECLSPRDIGRCSRVCHHWYRWINSSIRWKEFRRLFRNITPTKQWLFEQDNSEQLEAIMRMHFQNSVLIADVSHGDKRVFHIEIIQFLNGQWDWERPIWIWMKKNKNHRLRGRWGRYHIAGWPGPSWRQLFAPYFYFIQHGNKNSSCSIFAGWHFYVRYH